MAVVTDAADGGELDRVDRILLGTCAAVWLVALGAGVAATVALVDLGSRHGPPKGGSDTPWLLYAVIAVSAAVIIGAVPLLLRARRAALEESAPAPVRPGPGQQPPGREQPAAREQPPARGAEAPTEKLSAQAPPRLSRGPGYPTREAISNPPSSPAAAAVGRVWLRCAVVIAIAMGAAVVAIGVATYLMAIDHDAVSWALYVLAGLVTVGMPAIPWFYLRELRALR